MNFSKGILVFQTKINTKSKVTLLIYQNERDKSEPLPTFTIDENYQSLETFGSLLTNQSCSIRTVCNSCVIFQSTCVHCASQR